MTSEERFERIEHVTAGLVEQFGVEREENRQLWRETQRRMEEADRRLGDRIEELSLKIVEVDQRLGARIDEVNQRLGDRIQALAEESRAADKRLEERIGSLVSAIGKFIARE